MKTIKKVAKKIKKKVEKKKLVKRVSKKSAKKKEDTSYLKIGIPGFDSLFEKGYGIPSGAAVLIEGGPGSGKTVFCLSAVNGLCKEGKKCLYMSFEEPEEKLISHMANFKYDVDNFIKKGLLRVKRFDAIDVARSVEALLSAAKKELLIELDPVLFPKDFSPDFIVIDSLTSIASAFSGHENRFRIYMEQLFRYLERNKITNFLVREVSSPSHVGTNFVERGEAVSFLSDGIVVVYNVVYNTGERKSAIEILKMRGVGFEKKIVEMEIEDKIGLVVRPEHVLKRSSGNNFQLT